MNKKTSPFIFVFAWGFWSASIATLHSQAYAWSTIAGLANQSGYTDGTNGGARFALPWAVSVDVAGNLYVTDIYNYAVRKVTPVGTNWVVSTIAGGSQGSSDGTNTNAQFHDLEYIAVDSATNLYVPDNSTIRKITAVGTNWVVTTVVGLAGFQDSVDGTNSDARFLDPEGVTVDAAGNLYVTDPSGYVRKVAPIGTNWVVTTLAGTAGVRGSSDGTNGDASFFGPEGLAVDGAGNLYVADTSNNEIRKVMPVGTNWVVSTLAGLAGIFDRSGADGTNSAARFLNPYSISVDGAGILYVADTSDHTIRKIIPIGTNWVVSTLGGLAGQFGSVDGTGSNARFLSPNGITIDTTGNIYVADYSAFVIRKGTPLSVAAPILKVVFSIDHMVLSWPLAATGFMLETSSALVAGTVWIALTNRVWTNDNRFVLTNSPTSTNAFYRLRKN